MSAAFTFSRRHLQTLLKLPRTTASAPSSRVPSPLRTVCTAYSYSNSATSVTFGQKTDDLIESYTGGVKGKPTSKNAKPNRKSPGRTPLDTGSIEITLDGDNEAILATRAPVSDVGTLLSSRRAGSTASDLNLTQTKPTRELPEANRKAKQPRENQTNPGAQLSKSVNARDLNRSVGPVHLPKDVEKWQVQKHALKTKFGDSGWKPRKRLSPDAVEGLRQLHVEDPIRYSTPVLAEQFKVSPEAIRRILKSKWKPKTEEVEERRQRWARRHDRIWDQKAALGLRPPRRKDREPEGPEAFDDEIRAKQLLGQI